MVDALPVVNIKTTKITPYDNITSEMTVGVMLFRSIHKTINFIYLERFIGKRNHVAKGIRHTDIHTQPRSSNDAMHIYTVNLIHFLNLHNYYTDM